MKSYEQVIAEAKANPNHVVYSIADDLSEVPESTWLIETPPYEITEKDIEFAKWLNENC